MATVLGLSFGYHDSSVALIRSPEDIVHLYEERFTKIKHDKNFPHNCLMYLQQNYNLKFNEIDLVVYHEDVKSKFSRVLYSTLKGAPRSSQEFIEASRSWLNDKLWTLPKISYELNISNERIFNLNHHFSHACGAFLTSGFEESAILIVDAVGEWSSTVLYYGKYENGIPKIEKIKEYKFPNSLGLFYSSITSFLGFRPNDQECSTMALSSFGNPTYTDEFKKIISTSNHDYRINDSYFNFIEFFKNPYSKKFVNLFGEPKKNDSGYNYSCLEQDVVNNQITDINTNQKYADLAATAQNVFETAILNLTEEIKKLTNCDNLCYGGGAALNCKANSVILNSKIFNSIYIPPDPGDGGSSLGAALFGYLSKKNDNSRIKSKDAYYGSETQIDDDLLKIIDKFDSYKIQKHVDKSLSWRPFKKLVYKKIINESDLAIHVANKISRSQVVGIHRGRSESGPRALGHRSILFRADNYSLAKKVSTQIKKREFYRPYALMLSPKAASNIFRDYDLSHDKTHSYMQFTSTIKDEYLNYVRAGVHIDGSTRPQICHQGDDKFLTEMLIEVGKHLGVEAVINTSLNESGLPINNTFLDSLIMFCRTNMDVLVCNELMIEKIYD